MAKRTKKQLDVYLEGPEGDTEYEKVSGLEIEDGGVLRFREVDGDVHWVSASTKWHVIERHL